MIVSIDNMNVADLELAHAQFNLDNDVDAQEADELDAILEYLYESDVEYN